MIIHMIDNQAVFRGLCDGNKLFPLNLLKL